MTEINQQKSGPITALVVGAGSFGRHYVTNLAKLNSDSTLGIPQIGKIVFTKTDFEKTKLAEKAFREQLQSETCPEIIGECSRSLYDLDVICGLYKPQIIFITARDPGSFGNKIHVEYTHIGLQYSNVMCEKPFTDATGDGMSIEYAEELAALEHGTLKSKGHTFSLELPLIQVRKELEASTSYADRIRDAGSIRIFYSTLKATPEMIINDLAIHAWSMIPEEFSFREVNTSESGNLITISSILTDNITPRKRCDTELLPGGNFGGMSIDNYVLGFKPNGPGIDVVEMNTSYAEAIMQDRNNIKGKVIAKVENPLRKNIVSAIRGAPATGVQRVIESQTFLENAFGYR